MIVHLDLYFWLDTVQLDLIPLKGATIHQKFFQTQICLGPEMFRPEILLVQKTFERKFLQIQNFFRTWIFFQTKFFFRPQIFFEIFFGPNIFLDQHFLKPFQAEQFRLESCYHLLLQINLVVVENQDSLFENGTF